MRMNRQGDGPRAIDLIRDRSARDLEDLFRRFGEERQARRIARAIERARSESPIETTGRLAEIVEEAVGSGGRIHPATRVFQALRIGVNEELEHLEAGLAEAMCRLRPGGRIGVISFHSLEDRIVKRAFRGAVEGERWRLGTRRPVRATPGEIDRNPRSRSAGLRVLIREEGGR
jgi:16S rRNA (cytosine1402-N4)-methyltransferase